MDELEALKRTLIDISTPAKGITTAKQKLATQDTSVEQLLTPSFVRVMQAEQTLSDNYAYTEGTRGDAGELTALIANSLNYKPFDSIEETDADVDQTNSIPQESSIAGNVSF